MNRARSRGRVDARSWPWPTIRPWWLKSRQWGSWGLYEDPTPGHEAIAANAPNCHQNSGWLDDGEHADGTTRTTKRGKIVRNHHRNRFQECPRRRRTFFAVHARSRSRSLQAMGAADPEELQSRLPNRGESFILLFHCWVQAACGNPASRDFGDGAAERACYLASRRCSFILWT